MSTVPAKTDKNSENANATRAFLGEESKWSAVQIELNDIQGLWGGRKIYIKGTGHALVQLVRPGMQERRYELALSVTAWTQLVHTFIEKDFVAIVPPERAGIPDEARPQITIVNPAREQRTVSKWDGVKEERFDAIYRMLVGLETLTEQLKPVYEGSYSPDTMEFGLSRGPRAPYRRV